MKCENITKFLLEFHFTFSKTCARMIEHNGVSVGIDYPFSEIPALRKRIYIFK